MRWSLLGALSALVGWSGLTVFLLACGEDLRDAIVPVTHWRMNRHVQPDHPMIESWAADIRAVTDDPLEQVAMAEQAVSHGIRYWDAYDTWGWNNCIPSLDEMILRARQRGWHRLRGNCVSQSIVACSLLRSLGIEARIHATVRHAWVSCLVQRRELNLLREDMGQTGLDAYLPKARLSGRALEAAMRLGADGEGVFRSLPVLQGSKADVPYFKDPYILLAWAPLLVAWIPLFRAWDRGTCLDGARRAASVPEAVTVNSSSFGPDSGAAAGI